MEGCGFDKQCSKVKDITALQSSLLAGAFVTAIMTIFACVLSATDNGALFEGHGGLWQLRVFGDEGGVSGVMQRLLVLLGYQLLVPH